jgi:hypothetical protein
MSLTLRDSLYENEERERARERERERERERAENDEMQRDSFPPSFP